MSVFVRPKCSLYTIASPPRYQRMTVIDIKNVISVPEESYTDPQSLFQSALPQNQQYRYILSPVCPPRERLLVRESYPNPSIQTYRHTASPLATPFHANSPTSPVQQHTSTTIQSINP